MVWASGDFCSNRSFFLLPVQLCLYQNIVIDNFKINMHFSSIRSSLWAKHIWDLLSKVKYSLKKNLNIKNKTNSKNIKPFPKKQHLSIHRWGHCDLWLRMRSPKGWRWPHMASPLHLSPFPTLQFPWLLPSWDSSLQSQGGGTELKLFAFHYDFQGASAAHVNFSFNCLIPATLFTQELIRFYQVSPVPLHFNPFFSSPRSTVLTDTLGWEMLCRPLSLGNVILVPTSCIRCLDRKSVV